MQEKLNFKFIFIASIVMTDFIMTAIGIRAGIYEEANILMTWLFEIDIMTALFFKLIYTTALLIIIHKLNDHETKLSKSLMNITMAAYILVNIYHYKSLYDLVIFTFA